jgi:LSD1 subclass zinc finger protein
MHGNKIFGSNCNLAGMDMAQLICRGCRSLLMYPHGATTVRCSCCHVVNIAPGKMQNFMNKICKIISGHLANLNW